MRKSDNKKWIFLGAAILLATVVIAIILNLPLKNEGIGGNNLNAAIITEGTKVKIISEMPAGEYSSFFAVPESNPIKLGVRATLPSGKTIGNFWAKNSAITILKTSGGAIVYCIELGNPVGVGTTNTRTANKTSNYWTNLGTTKQENIGLVTLYSYPNKNRSGYTETEQYAAAQILIWEFQQGYRTNLENVPSNKEIYNRWVTKKSKLKEVYESILNDMKNHSSIPDLGSTLKLKYNSSSKKYEGTINNVGGLDYACSSKLTCTKSGTQLKITSSSSLVTSEEIVFTKQLPSGISQGMLILDNGKEQRMLVGKANVTKPSTKVKVTTQAEEKLGSLTIKKNTEDNSTETFKFLVTSIINSYSKTITVNGGSEVTLTNLKSGIYTITEVDCPDKYSRQLPKIVFVGTEPTSTTITNYLKNNGSATINKVDENGNPVKGATMELKNYLNIVVDVWTSDGNPHVVQKLEANKEYKVCEVKAPSGYVLNKECQKFTLNDKNDSVVVNFVNEKTETTVTKVDESGKALEGAVLQIKDKKGNIVVQPWRTTSETKKQIKGLTNGTKYILEEIEAPLGYVKSENIEFTAGGEVKVVNKKSEVVISKQDATTGKEIAGAHLQLIDSTGKIVEEWISDGKSHSIKGLIIGNEYTLKETKAPQGYFVASSLKFTFDKNKKAVVMQDTPLFVEISKQDATTGKEIAGAELEVIDSAGKTIEKWTSEADKTHTIKGLINGQTYTLKETIAPDGYAISEEITFIAGESKKVIMKDDPTKVIIKKLDTVTNKRVVGAGLQLLDENKKVLAEWQTTDEDFVITKLSVGKQYFVKEVKTPDNYLETEVVPFTLQANQNNIEVVINNTPIVYVPNTADNVNIITIVVGAIVVLGGIGTIIWIRKRSA